MWQSIRWCGGLEAWSLSEEGEIQMPRQSSTPSWRERLRAVSCPTRLIIHPENKEILHSNVKLRAIHLLEILWFCCWRQLDFLLVGGKDRVFWHLSVIREIMTGFKMAGWSPSYPHMRDGHTIIGSYNWVWPSSGLNNLEENSWCRPPSQWVEEWRSPSGQNLNKT